MSMNINLGKHYEKIIRKAIQRGFAKTKIEVLRQALTLYDKILEAEVPSKESLKKTTQISNETLKKYGNKPMKKKKI